LFFAATPASALLRNAPTESSATAIRWFGSAGLTYGRVFGAPNRGELIRFVSTDAAATPVGGSVFGFEFALPLTERVGSATPVLFGQFASAVRQDAHSIAKSDDAQTVGMRFKLLGGESSFALASIGPSFHTGVTAGFSGQGPAVFAFYNFAQATTNAGNAFGLFGQSGGGALAAELNAAPLQGDSAGAASSITLPLISSLSAQGPFWYGDYSPAARGSSVQLNLPFKVAKIPVKVSLREQALTEVQPFSLATQILGPAFASSAANKYNAVGGGVTLALPLLNRRATVSLDGLYQTLQRGDQAPFALMPLGANSNANINAGAAPGAAVYYPNYDGLQQYVGAASVALPVTSSLTVKGSFSERRSGGVDLDALTQSLTQRTTAYGGGLVYNIPKTNSSINLFFNRNVYTQDNVPTYNWSENRQNLFFSVKF
jgi:hypothetical protein